MFLIAKISFSKLENIPTIVLPAKSPKIKILHVVKIFVANLPKNKVTESLKSFFIKLISGFLMLTCLNAKNNPKIPAIKNPIELKAGTK